MPPPAKKPNPKTKPRPTIGVTKGTGPCSSPGCTNANVLVQVQCSNCATYICQQHEWGRNTHHLHGVRECSGPCENMYCSACDEMELCRVCHIALCEDCGSQNATLMHCSSCDEPACDPDSRSGLGMPDCALTCASCGEKVCQDCLRDLDPCFLCNMDPLCPKCLEQCSSPDCEVAACKSHVSQLAARYSNSSCKKYTCHSCYDEGGGTCFGCERALPGASQGSGRAAAAAASAGQAAAASAGQAAAAAAGQAAAASAGQAAAAAGQAAAVANGAASPAAAAAGERSATVNGETTVIKRLAAGENVNGGSPVVSVTTHGPKGEIVQEGQEQVLTEAQLNAMMEAVLRGPGVAVPYPAPAPAAPAGAVAAALPPPAAAVAAAAAAASSTVAAPAAPAAAAGVATAIQPGEAAGAPAAASNGGSHGSRGSSAIAAAEYMVKDVVERADAVVAAAKAAHDRWMQAAESHACREEAVRAHTELETQGVTISQALRELDASAEAHGKGTEKAEWHVLRASLASAHTSLAAQMAVDEAVASTISAGADSTGSTVAATATVDANWAARLAAGGAAVMPGTPEAAAAAAKEAAAAVAAVGSPGTAVAAGANGAAAAAQQSSTEDDWDLNVAVSGRAAAAKRNKKKEKKAKKKGAAAAAATAPAAAGAAATNANGFLEEDYAAEETAVSNGSMNGARFARRNAAAPAMTISASESLASWPPLAGAPLAAAAASAPGAAAAAAASMPFEELRQFVMDVTLRGAPTTFRDIADKFSKRIEEPTIADIFNDLGGDCRETVRQLAAFVSIEIPQQSREQAAANTAAAASASSARSYAEMNGAGATRGGASSGGAAASASSSNGAMDGATNQWEASSLSVMSPTRGAGAYPEPVFGARAAIDALVAGGGPQQQQRQQLSPMRLAAQWQNYEADDASVDASAGRGGSGGMYDGGYDVSGRGATAAAAAASNTNTANLEPSAMHLRIEELVAKEDLRALEVLAVDIRGRVGFADERKTLKKSINELKRQREAALLARGIAPPKPRLKPEAAAAAAPAPAGLASPPAAGNSRSFVLPEPPEGGGPNGYLSLRSPPPGCDDFWMPVWLGIVGWLIGPQGKRIKTIMNESGANVRVEPGLRAREEKQQVHIWGTPASVRAAFDIIQNELMRAPSQKGAFEYFASDYAASLSMPAPAQPPAAAGATSASAAAMPAGSGYNAANSMDAQRMVGMLTGKPPAAAAAPAARSVSPTPPPGAAAAAAARGAALASASAAASPAAARMRAGAVAAGLPAPAGAGSSFYAPDSGDSNGRSWDSLSGRYGGRSGGGGGGGDDSDGSSKYGSAASDLQPVAGCQRLREFLEEIKIAEYYDAFILGGWDLRSVLAGDINSDFGALKLKPGHKVRLRNAINKARSQQPPPQQQNGAGRGAAAATNGGGGTVAAVAAAAAPPAAAAALAPGGGSEEDTHLCVVCVDALRTAMFLPCRHRCVCEECADLVVNSGRGHCLMCRLDYTSILRNIN